MAALPFVIDHFTQRTFGKSIFPDLNDNYVSDWLYGDWNEEKYDRYLQLRSMDPTGLVGNYFDYLLDRRSDYEYLKNHGLTYNDIHDPRKLRQSSSAQRLGSNYIRTVSSNVNRLYR